MGRSRGGRWKQQNEIESVRPKCIESRLKLLIRSEFGVCEAETETVAGVSLRYLSEVSGERGPLEVVLDVPEGRGVRWKVDAQKVTRRRVRMSPLSADDLDVWLELGVRGMQTGRAVRLIEQADRAGCTMPQGLLSSCVHLTTRTFAALARVYRAYV